jgi:hypothetical protein
MATPSSFTKKRVAAPGKISFDPKLLEIKCIALVNPPTFSIAVLNMVQG